jgi:probable HAF family extracellular repeat protein
MQDLGTLGGKNSFAGDINASGQIVGASTLDNESNYRYEHAFLYSDGKMQDLSSWGGDYSSANAINDRGQVVGTSFERIQYGLDSERAILYSNGQTQDISTLDGSYGGSAIAINASGQVLGNSFNPNGGAERPFLYSNGQIIDINSLLAPDSDWRIGFATGLNDKGQIILNGSRIENSKIIEHALLLTPTPVPLPATVWLFASALAGFSKLSQRRKIA